MVLDSNYHQGPLTTSIENKHISRMSLGNFSKLQVAPQLDKATLEATLENGQKAVDKGKSNKNVQEYKKY